MSVYALGTLFVQLTLGMNAFITAQGFTKISMLSVVIGAVSNIILDPIFIYLFNMGVKGAALATVISQCLSSAFIVSFLLGKKTVLRLRKKNMIPRPSVFLPCVALGSAAFIMQASESVISVCFNSSLLKYGGDIAVGAMTILTSIMQFALLPTQGIAQGAQPILSYNYGAKNAERVSKTFKILLTVCLIYSVSLWALVILFPRMFVSIFTPDGSLIDFASGALRIYFSGMIFFGIQIACQMAFVSLGNAPSSVLVAVVRKFVLLLPLIYIMPHLISDPAVGVYMAEPIADVIAVSFTAVLFFFQFKRALRKIN
jgi:putative MATE family efflux protein